MKEPFYADRSLAFLTHQNTPPVESTMTVWAALALLLVLLTMMIGGS